jgi:hypothetical protein
VAFKVKTTAPKVRLHRRVLCARLGDPYRLLMVLSCTVYDRIQVGWSLGRALKSKVSCVLRWSAPHILNGAVCIVWRGTSHATGHEGRTTVGGQMQGQVSDPKHDYHARKGDSVSHRYREPQFSSVSRKLSFALLTSGLPFSFCATFPFT